MSAYEYSSIAPMLVPEWLTGYAKYFLLVGSVNYVMSNTVLIINVLINQAIFFINITIYSYYMH